MGGKEQIRISKALLKQEFYRARLNYAMSHSNIRSDALKKNSSSLMRQACKRDTVDLRCLSKARRPFHKDCLEPSRVDVSIRREKIV